MITVKDAVLSATTAAEEFYIGNRLKDIMLEEVEMSEDGRNWLITLGFYVQDIAAPSLAGLLQGSQLQRKYKVFTVRGDNGEVVSMKIRDP